MVRWICDGANLTRGLRRCNTENENLRSAFLDHTFCGDALQPAASHALSDFFDPRESLLKSHLALRRRQKRNQLSIACDPDAFAFAGAIHQFGKPSTRLYYCDLKHGFRVSPCPLLQRSQALQSSAIITSRRFKMIPSMRSNTRKYAVSAPAARITKTIAATQICSYARATNSATAQIPTTAA